MLCWALFVVLIAAWLGQALVYWKDAAPECSRYVWERRGVQLYMATYNCLCGQLGMPFCIAKVPLHAMTWCCHGWRFAS
jgi:hypothetical protein